MSNILMNMKWLAVCVLLMAACNCNYSRKEGQVYNPATRKYVEAPPIPATDELARHSVGISNGMLGFKDRACTIRTAVQRRHVEDMLQGAKVVCYVPGKSTRVSVVYPEPWDCGECLFLEFDAGSTLPGEYTLEVPKTQYDAGIKALLGGEPWVRTGNAEFFKH